MHLIDANIAVSPESGKMAGCLVCFNDGTIINSSVTGMVSAHGYVGGLVSDNRGTISNCSANCLVIAAYLEAGGLVASNSGTIVESFSACDVIAEVTAGGLAGINRGIITDSYSYSTIRCERISGGLVGDDLRGTITKCYAAAEVNASSDVGGFIGYSQDPVQYSACFWDSNIAGDINGIGNGSDPNVIGLPTAQMRTAGTFTAVGWDFVWETVNGPNDMWAICEGVSYPKLAWQFLPGDSDGDEDVDFPDFAPLGLKWIQADSNLYCGGSDFTGDGMVNLDDLAAVCDNWLIAPE